MAGPGVGADVWLVARRLLTEPIAFVFAVREDDEGQEVAGLPELLVRGLSPGDAGTLLDSLLPGRLDERVRERILAELAATRSRFSRAGSTFRFEGAIASAAVTVRGRGQRETLRRALEPVLSDVVQATWNLHERTPEPELALRARPGTAGLRQGGAGQRPARRPRAHSRPRGGGRARPARRPMRSPSRRSLRDRGPT